MQIFNSYQEMSAAQGGGQSALSVFNALSRADDKRIKQCAARIEKAIPMMQAIQDEYAQCNALLETYAAQAMEDDDVALGGQVEYYEDLLETAAAKLEDQNFVVGVVPGGTTVVGW